MFYINFKHGGKVETVDEFNTKREAKEMVREYNLSDFTHSYYISTRCTKEWKEG